MTLSSLKHRIKQAAWLQAFLDHLPIHSRAVVRRQQEHLDSLENELADANLRIGQLSHLVKETGGLLPPPMKLQKRVLCRFFDRFFENGAETVIAFDRILAPTGRLLKSFDSILDFGVGCGRIARPLRSYIGSGAKLYGTDIDIEAIDWCRQNYGEIAVFESNDLWPPLKHPDNSFDLVYGMSVFTHLPEEMQFKWLAELNRILKPDGYLILTTHGEAYYSHLSDQRRAELDTKGFIHFNNGLTPGLPDFYQTTFHTPDYIRRRWTDHLQVISIEPRGILGRQDAILCQKK